MTRGLSPAPGTAAGLSSSFPNMASSASAISSPLSREAASCSGIVGSGRFGPGLLIRSLFMVFSCCGWNSDTSDTLTPGNRVGVFAFPGQVKVFSVSRWVGSIFRCHGVRGVRGCSRQDVETLAPADYLFGFRQLAAVLVRDQHALALEMSRDLGRVEPIAEPVPRRRPDQDAVGFHVAVEDIRGLLPDLVGLRGRLPAALALADVDEPIVERLVHGTQDVGQGS